MRLSGWLRRSSFDEPAEIPAARRWRWVGGRKVLATSLYIMPKDKAEGDRLDLQHHLLKIALNANYRAPIRQPRMILDVACGTGIWGREMAQKFKHAQVTGFDIDRTPLEAALERLGASGQFPPNFTFLTADALKPFPFDDETFDFTFARLISPFVPIARWPGVVAEMARVTRKGGYVEIIDMEPAESPSPAFTLLLEALKRLVVKRGLHAGAGPHLANYLRQARLSQVQERDAVLGTGRQKTRQQRLIAADVLATFTNIEPIIIQARLLSKETYHNALQRVKEELPEAHITWKYTSAFGLRLT